MFNAELLESARYNYEIMYLLYETTTFLLVTGGERVINLETAEGKALGKAVDRISCIIREVIRLQFYLFHFEILHISIKPQQFNTESKTRLPIQPALHSDC